MHQEAKQKERRCRRTFAVSYCYLRVALYYKRIGSRLRTLHGTGVSVFKKMRKTRFALTAVFAISTFASPGAGRNSFSATIVCRWFGLLLTRATIESSVKTAFSILSR